MQTPQRGFSNARLFIRWPYLLSQDPTGSVLAKGLVAATEQGAGVVGHTGSRHRELLQSKYPSSRVGLFQVSKQEGSPAKTTRAKLKAKERLSME